MKIKSNYKDYYDHVAHIYGGGDPKIVYVRPHKLKEIPDFKNLEMTKGRYGREFYKSGAIQNLVDLSRHWEMRFGNKGANIKGIIVCNKLFTQIKHEGETEYRLLRDIDLLKSEKYRRFSFYDEKPMLLKDYIDFYDENLVNVCKKIGHPVFAINVNPYNFSSEVDEYIPNLGKVGVANFIDANTMYQNISYMIGNLLRDCPDTMPVPIVTDKDKILGHGFDYKTSFRGKVM